MLDKKVGYRFSMRLLMITLLMASLVCLLAFFFCNGEPSGRSQEPVREGENAKSNGLRLSNGLKQIDASNIKMIEQRYRYIIWPIMSKSKAGPNDPFKERLVHSFDLISVIDFNKVKIRAKGFRDPQTIVLTLKGVDRGPEKIWSEERSEDAMVRLNELIVSGMHPCVAFDDNGDWHEAAEGYIWVDAYFQMENSTIPYVLGVIINEELILEGLVSYKDTRPDSEYSNVLRMAQDDAMLNLMGIWGDG